MTEYYCPICVESHDPDLHPMVQCPKCNMISSCEETLKKWKTCVYCRYNISDDRYLTTHIQKYIVEYLKKYGVEGRYDINFQQILDGETITICVLRNHRDNKISYHQVHASVYQHLFPYTCAIEPVFVSRLQQWLDKYVKLLKQPVVVKSDEEVFEELYEEDKEMYRSCSHSVAVGFIVIMSIYFVFSMIGLMCWFMADESVLARQIALFFAPGLFLEFPYPNLYYRNVFIGHVICFLMVWMIFSIRLYRYYQTREFVLDTIKGRTEFSKWWQKHKSSYYKRRYDEIYNKSLIGDLKL